MCGRYTLYDFEDLAEHFGLGELPDLKANYNVTPTQMMPIVTTDGLDMMRWGLIPVWARDEKIGYKLINARSETIFNKPVWSNAVSHHRCLVPANGFYEWKAWSGGKQPYFIRPSASHLFTIAGAWSS